MTESVAELETKALSIPEQAKALTIVDAPSYEMAGGVLVQIKSLRAEVATVFDPIIDKAYEAHKTAIAQRKRVETPLIQAENYLKPLMAEYMTSQEKKRREEEAKAQDALRKKAEDEQLEKARQAEARGDHRKAEAILNQPVIPPPVILPTQTPKINGVSFRKTWAFKVDDETLIPREYLTPDLSKIGQVVRALKGQTKIPGVSVYEGTGVSAGTGI